MKSFISNKLAINLNRITAWILFASVLLFFISGYGISKGLISSGTAFFLHNKFLPPIAIPAFLIHSFLGIRVFFIRLRIWNKVTFTISILMFFGGLAYLIYLQYFFRLPSINTTTPKTHETQIEEEAINITDSQIFTLQELAQFSGQNGNPAYVAIDGVVYDVSAVFKNGSHYEHMAGQELTSAFYLKHVKSQITKYPVVGRLAN